MDANRDYYVEMSQGKVFSQLQKIAKKYKKAQIEHDREVAKFTSEINDLETILSEIKTIEESVRLGLLKSFKIKKAMIPSEYKDRNELEEVLQAKKERLLELNEVNVLKEVVRTAYHDLFSRMFVRKLFDVNYSTRHITMSMVEDRWNSIEISLVATSPLGLLALGDWVAENTKWEVGRMALEDMDDYDSARKVFRERADFLINNEYVHPSVKAVIETFKPTIENISDKTLDEFASELYENGRVSYKKGIPYYEKPLREKEREEGIDVDNESIYQRQTRRMDKLPEYNSNEIMTNYIKNLAELESEV